MCDEIQGPPCKGAILEGILKAICDVMAQMAERRLPTWWTQVQFPALDPMRLRTKI